MSQEEQKEIELAVIFKLPPELQETAQKNRFAALFAINRAMEKVIIEKYLVKSKAEITIPTLRGSCFPHLAATKSENPLFFLARPALTYYNVSNKQLLFIRTTRHTNKKPRITLLWQLTKI